MERLVGAVICFVIAWGITKLLMLMCDWGVHTPPESPCKDCKCTDCEGCKYAK